MVWRMDNVDVQFIHQSFPINFEIMRLWINITASDSISLRINMPYYLRYSLNTCNNSVTISKTPQINLFSLKWMYRFSSVLFSVLNQVLGLIYFCNSHNFCVITRYFQSMWSAWLSPSSRFGLLQCVTRAEVSAPNSSLKFTGAQNQITVCGLNSIAWSLSHRLKWNS